MGAWGRIRDRLVYGRPATGEATYSTGECECASLRLIGRSHQCPRCCVPLLPGEEHRTQEDCDRYIEEWVGYTGYPPPDGPCVACKNVMEQDDECPVCGYVEPGLPPGASQ